MSDKKETETYKLYIPLDSEVTVDILKDILNLFGKPIDYKVCTTNVLPDIFGDENSL